MKRRIPIDESVSGACEILGFDPLYVANEGKLLAFVSSEDADNVLAAMRAHPLGKEAAIIGEVTEEPSEDSTYEEPYRRDTSSRHAFRRAIAEDMLTLISIVLR